MSSLRSESARGIAWSAIENFALYVIRFGLSIVLARLLMPSDYGIIGMIGVFLAISQTFIDCGFGSALIHDIHRDERDYSTVFWFNLLVATVCCMGLCIGSGWISDFYRTPALKHVTCWISLTLVVDSIASVQRTMLTINLDFKSQAKASVVSMLISGVTGIFLAYKGFGVWALVAQTLISSSLNTALLSAIVRWHPTSFISRRSLRKYFSYGSKLLCSNLINRVYSNLHGLIIGKVFSAETLGLYFRGDSLARLVPDMGVSVLGRVVFPVLSKIQDDDERLRHVYQKYIRLTTGAILPFMVGLTALADPLVRVLLGEKWMSVVPYIRVLSLAWLFDPIIQVNANILFAKGRTDIGLWLEIVRKSIALVILFVSVRYGVMAMCWGRVLYAVVSVAILAQVIGSIIIKRNFISQMMDVMPIYIVSFVMGLSSYFVTLIIPGAGLLDLIFGVIIGAAVFLILGYILKIDIVVEVINYISTKRRNSCA